MSLPHTPEALQGQHVRIQRHGHTYEGVVKAASMYKEPLDYFEPGDLALMVHMDGESAATGFWLPCDAVVEEL